MAINYATKYSPKVDERFTLKSLTEAAVNKDYDWQGVDTIKVYSIPTVPLAPYTLSGLSRYGTPEDLGNEVQTLILSKDEGFTYILDRKSLDDTVGAMQAGKSLARQIDEQIIPTIDAYRLNVMATAASANGATDTAAITKSNAYAKFLEGAEWFGNKKVPMTKRIAFVSYSFYSLIKQDPAFMLASEISKKDLVNGQVGKVDGFKIVPVPSSYLPSNTAFIMAHPSATVAANKLEDYKIHDNPPGISGSLVEGRIRYDAFVLNSKKDALYIHKTA